MVSLSTFLRRSAIISLLAFAFWASAAPPPGAEAIERGVKPELDKGAKAFDEWLHSFSGHVSAPVRTAAVEHIVDRCAISGKSTAAATSFGELAAVAVKNLSWTPRAETFILPTDKMVLGELNTTGTRTGFFLQQRMALKGDVLQVRPKDGSAGADMSMPRVKGLFAEAAQKVLSQKYRP